MDLREESIGGITILEVTGRIDSATAPVLGQKLTGVFASAQQRLVLDLRQIEYISSAGFRILLLAAKRAEEAGSRFVLCGIAGKVRQLFDLGGFLDVFGVSSTREEAISAVQ